MTTAKPRKKSAGEETSRDLSETVTVRLSPALVEMIDWYANLLGEREAQTIARPEAMRRMVAFAGRELQKRESASS